MDCAAPKSGQNIQQALAMLAHKTDANFYAVGTEIGKNKENLQVFVGSWVIPAFLGFPGLVEWVS